MKYIIYALLCCCLLIACNKETATTNNSSNPGSTTQNDGSASNHTSTISFFINDEPVAVTAISYDRSGSTFNFTAGNSLKKAEVRCFWFYQQSGFNFQFSDSINYCYRADTLSNWSSIRAINYGNVNFDCCEGPLTDSPIEGDYSGDFADGKNTLKINGSFKLFFKK